MKKSQVTAQKKAQAQAKADAPKARVAQEKTRQRKAVNNTVAGKSTALTVVEASKASEIVIDMSVPLAMNFHPDTTGNKKSERLLQPTQGNIEAVQELLKIKDWTAEFKKLSHDVQKLKWQIAHYCVAIAYKLQKEGHDAIPTALAFLAALEPLGKEYSAFRSVAVRDWLLKYAPVDWREPNNVDKKKTLVYDTQKKQKHAPEMRNETKYITTRLQKPFFMLRKQSDPQDWDLREKVKDWMKQLANAQKNKDNYANTNFDGVEEFKAACNLWLKGELHVAKNDNAKNEEEAEEELAKQVA